jgi:DNA polymerase-3 subunit alpha
VESIVAEREVCGPYKNFTEFAERFDNKALNRRALETMAAAGVFDVLDPQRARVYANIEPLLSYAARLAENRVVGQADLFGGGSGDGSITLQFRDTSHWDLMETLSHELEAIGFYLSGHPLDDYAEALEALNVIRWAELEAKVRDQANAEARIAATVTLKQERKSKSGNRFAFVGCSDPTGQFEAVVFSDTLTLAGEALEPGKAVLLHIEAELDGEAIKTRVRAAQDLDAALGRSRNCLCIRADTRLVPATLMKHIGQNGDVALKLCLQLKDLAREVELTLGTNFDISPRQAGVLKALPGVLEVTSS